MPSGEFVIIPQALQNTPCTSSPGSPSKLDPFALKLAGWLTTEAGRFRKQRRAVKQMHADLQALGYPGSYNRVAAFARLWHEIEHGKLPGTVVDVWAQERSTLMPVPRPFDGFVEHTKRVSPTCLIHFERNRYSVPAPYANRSVSLTLSVQIQIKRRSGRKLVTLPIDPVTGESAKARPWDTATTRLQLALARGHRWLAMLESGEAKSLKEIAAREGIDNSYFSKTGNRRSPQASARTRGNCRYRTRKSPN